MEEPYVSLVEEPPGAASAGAPAPWSPWDILKAFLLVIGGSLLMLVPVSLLAYAVAGGADNVEEDPEALAVVIGGSGVLQLMMLVAVNLFAVGKYGLGWSAVGLRLPERGWWLPVPLVIGSWIIMSTYFLALAAVGVTPDTDLPEAAYSYTAPIVALAVLSVGVAPVAEEIFFRGFVFGGLRGRLPVAVAALASGLLFGVVHVFNPGAFFLIPPITLVGALFALGYHYSRSLIPPMIAHFIFNAVSLAWGLATA